ncbi:MAG: hypothetical protein IAX21_03905 [Candidatus Bathyarchaeota archaeon]|nr:MAG: hypothetical protein NUK63_01655 [Candidatus Bathyarchaeum tardum]WNZ30007.1 MAG: hypothetical protein IAX21_03905 [Candidatus Bathyarchaeota archaeon]
MKIKTVLLMLVGGVILALMSALYSQDMTVGLGATITGYGLPWLWLEKVTTIVPGSPETFSLYGSGLNLLGDIAFWSIIVAVTYFVYLQIKS